jgi:agmatine deiminase
MSSRESKILNQDLMTVLKMSAHSPHSWPAEWEPQAATWIAWPHNRATWPDRFTPIPGVFRKFIAELSQVQPVHVLSGKSSLPEPPQDYLSDLKNVTVHAIATNDTWIRDFGPTFVRRLDDGALVGVNWHYNAWGGKWPPYDDDAKAGTAICQTIGCLRSASSLYCEGGALETDGEGTLLTTSSVLMSPSRNPGWSREMVEGELKRQLGVLRILWIDGGGLQGDDTDGHIDQLARFVAPGVVVAATSSSLSDPNHAGLAENVRILRKSLSATEAKLEVFSLPTPPPRSVDQHRVPESYCNFVLANGIVIVPTFRNDATDQPALRLFEQLLPNRRIIPLDASDLIWGLGAFHCASQQQPLC